MVMLQRPAPAGWISLDYGATSAPYSPSRPHQGRDWGYYYADATSRRVVAGVGGTVTRIVGDGGWNSGWGNHVEITVVPSVIRRLCHLATGTITARLGQLVLPATGLATMGSTGDTGGTIHLHEELWINGVRVDPRPYYTRHLPGTGDLTGTPTTPEEDELTAAEVKEIKAHIDARTEDARIIAAGTPGNGARLVRYARSDATGSVFALYDNGLTRGDGTRIGRFRVQVTQADDLADLADVATIPQATIWGYSIVWADDGVTRRPGRLVGYAESAATGSAFALYEDNRGGKVRRLLTAAEVPSEVPTVPQRELWAYAPTNQA